MLIFLALASQLGVAEAETANPDEAAAQLGQIEQNLKTSTEKQSAIATEMAAAVAAQNEISAKLITLAKTFDDQQKTTAAAERKAEKLAAEAVIIRSDLAEKQDALSELLAGLQKLAQNPPPPLVVEPHDVLEALRGAMMFGAVVPQMRDQAMNLKFKLERLEAIRTESEDNHQNLLAAQDALQNSKTELQATQAQKKALVIAQSHSLADEKIRASGLATQAKNMKQLLAALDEAKRQADLKQAADQLKLAALTKPAIAFTQTRGKLDLPATGEMLKQFGDDNGLGGKLDGLVIATPAGSLINSPIDAHVEFAGAFRSYGQLLILNAGEGYLVLLAGMNKISAEIGQSIKAGEPVGTMGDGPSSVALIGSEADNAKPVLYVEFRKNNEPIDPTPWWIAGRKEAMR